jgi:hypothetical protein
MKERHFLKILKDSNNFINNEEKENLIDQMVKESNIEEFDDIEKIYSTMKKNEILKSLKIFKIIKKMKKESSNKKSIKQEVEEQVDDIGFDLFG